MEPAPGRNLVEQMLFVENKANAKALGQSMKAKKSKPLATAKPASGKMMHSQRQAPVAQRGLGRAAPAKTADPVKLSQGEKMFRVVENAF